MIEVDLVVDAIRSLLRRGLTPTLDTVAAHLGYHEGWDDVRCRRAVREAKRAGRIQHMGRERGWSVVPGWEDDTLVPVEGT